MAREMPRSSCCPADIYTRCRPPAFPARGLPVAHKRAAPPRHRQSKLGSLANRCAELQQMRAANMVNGYAAAADRPPLDLHAVAMATNMHAITRGPKVSSNCRWLTLLSRYSDQRRSEHCGHSGRQLGPRQWRAHCDKGPAATRRIPRCQGCPAQGDNNRRPPQSSDPGCHRHMGDQHRIKMRPKAWVEKTGSHRTVPCTVGSRVRARNAQLTARRSGSRQHGHWSVPRR